MLILIIIPSQGAVTCTLSSNQPVLQDFLVISLKRISLKDEDIVKQLALTQDWLQGLGARATMSMITSYFYKEQKKNKTHQSSWLVV